MSAPRYAELQISSNFSFLRGASHPHEIVGAAVELGLETIAVTDRNSLAGVVRTHIAAKEAGLGYVVGCRLDPTDGFSVLCFPSDRAAYGRLASLLSAGKLHPDVEKGDCRITFADIAAAAAGQTFVIIPPQTLPHASAVDPDDAHLARRLGDAAG
ncbi:MAG: PHP domain-containing protein, partial [Pseudomonadota bacterium]